MEPLDTFFENSYVIANYFLKRVLLSGLGHCLISHHSVEDIIKCLLSFGLPAFEYTRDLCIKQKEEIVKGSWLYDPKLMLILDVLKEFKLIEQRDNSFYLQIKTIELSLPKHVSALSQYYPAFWRFCVLLSSKLWILTLFEFPCKVSPEVLSLVYKSLFFREQINKSLETLIRENHFSDSHEFKLYFYPSSLSDFYSTKKVDLKSTVHSKTPEDADLIVVNNFLNIYSLFELRTILKDKNFILIQPTKKSPLSAISILYSKKSLPENIMLKVNYSPTPITFVKYT